MPAAYSSSTAPRRGGRPMAWLAVAAVWVLAVVPACTGGGTATGTPTGSPSPSQSAATYEPVPPARSAARLARSAPRTFDATYRLVTADQDRRAAVRVRVAGPRYRVDVTSGGTTASLYTAPRGLVSCQADRRGRDCLLVAKPGERPPALFDAGVQRIFLRALPQIADGAMAVTPAGTWTGHHGRGPAQCYQVKRGVSDPGVYCFLTMGKWRGALARAEFASGSLSLTSIDSRFPRPESFRPPVRPTPLPR